MFLSFTRWLSKAKNQTRKPQRAAKRAATVRKRYIPYIEPLETRVVPAIDFVTNLGGGNTIGSLKAVITSAAAGDTIEFQTTGTILLTGVAVSINKNLTIDGTGANITVSGANLVGITKGGVFHVSSGNVSINNLTITGGTAKTGGGIWTSNGNLTLTNDTISGNTATSTIEAGGGIYNFGTLTLTNDIISGNSGVGGSGGGIDNPLNGGPVTLNNVTLSGNSAAFGGGILNGSTLTVTNSTITGNSASGSPFSHGGGIANVRNDSVTLSNDTISGNSATQGGGIWTENGNLTLTNDTLSRNSATSAGGIYNFADSSADSLYDTIIAGNTATASGPDFDAPLPITAIT